MTKNTEFDSIISNSREFHVQVPIGLGDTLPWIASCLSHALDDELSPNDKSAQAVPTELYIS